MFLHTRDVATSFVGAKNIIYCYNSPCDIIVDSSATTGLPAMSASRTLPSILIPPCCVSRDPWMPHNFTTETFGVRIRRRKSLHSPPYTEGKKRAC